MPRLLTAAAPSVDPNARRDLGQTTAMKPLELALLLIAIVVAAIALDLLAIWIWRYLRSSRVKDGGSDEGPESRSIPRFIPGLVQVVERPLRGMLTTLRTLAQVGVRELRSSERTLLRAFFVLACLLTTISFGYLYADDIMVAGWQIWAFLLCVLVAALALLPGTRAPLHLGREHLWLLALLIAALALRAVDLDRIPQGLHVDEVGAADFAMRHVFPPTPVTISPFRTGPSSQPTLYYYMSRLSFAIFGENVVGLRLPSAIAGSLGVLATYALVSALHSRRLGLMAALLVATSHFHIHWSRIGLNNIWDTLWVPAILGAYAWGWKTKWSGGAVLSGLALGLSQYFYAGSKIAIPLLLLLVYRLWREQPDHSRLMTHGSKTFGMALVVAAPMLVFGLLNPDIVLDRLYSGLIWKPAGLGLPETDPSQIPPVLDQLLRSIFSFTSIAESTGFYRPGVPLVVGLAVPLLLAGTLWSLYKRRYLPVLWMGLTVLLGGFLLHALPASNHYVVAIPAISWLIAQALDGLAEHGRLPIAVAALAIVAVTDLVFYFGFYAPGPSGDLIHQFPDSVWNQP